MREFSDLMISGTINREMVDKLLKEVQKDYYQPEKILRLAIDSPGGSIPLALTAARFLMNCFEEIHTYNLSVVDSAAVCFYLCGTRRYATSTSRFFMHPPAVLVDGMQTEQQLEEILQGLQTDTKCMINFYGKRTHIGREKWEKVFRNTCYMMVGQAQELGIVTDICEQIPRFSPHIISTETMVDNPPIREKR